MMLIPLTEEGRQMLATRRVIVPACAQHEGIYRRAVTLRWNCPVCGCERGEPVDTVSYDGSRRLHVDGWVNPCGHVDKYADVRAEADSNGLNELVERRAGRVLESTAAHR